MLTRILTGGLIGGVVGGAIIAAIQAISTTPLILHAEQFESAEAVKTLSVTPVQVDAKATHAAGLYASRLLSTSIATIAVATGYTLLLLGGMVATGRKITGRSVIPWAVAGFFATGLAPALGLAPELPGSAAADLGARQIWWIGTALATAAGLAALAFGRGVPWIAAGIGLILLPHLIGAPHPPSLSSKVPAEIAAHFASISLVMQALIWLVPAAIAGVAIAWMQKRDASAGAEPVTEL